MEKEEIRDLIETLDSVGHSGKLEMSISVGINPNEFLLTNVFDFLESKRRKMTENGVEVKFVTTSLHQISSVGSMDSNKHSVILTGLHWKVREAYEEVLRWPWVDPSKTFISFEESIG